MDIKPKKKLALKSWLGVAGLIGAGLLPCPDCGAPMIAHFWPLALLIALRNLVRKKTEKTALRDHASDQNAASSQKIVE